MNDGFRDITPDSPHPILRNARDREGVALDAADGAEHAMRALAHELTGIIDSCLRCVGRARASADPTKAVNELALGAADSYLRAVEASLAEAGDLVKAIMRTGSLAGPPSGRVLSPRRAPAEILVHAAEALMPLADESSVHLTTKIAPGTHDLPPLPIFPVISNALRNAIEATRPGGRVVARLSLINDAPSAPADLLLHIDDDGPGPPTDFDPFEPGRSRKEGGWGLGLAIAKEVATELGGTVSLTPRDEGIGTRFELRVPITQRVIG